MSNGRSQQVMASTSTSSSSSSDIPSPPNRPIYIAKLKGQPNRRGHMMIYIPNLTSLSHDPSPSSSENREGRPPSPGTVLQVIGAPMLGFNHEIIRNHNINDESNGVLSTLALVGLVEGRHVRDPPSAGLEKTDRTYDADSLEGWALRTAAPRKTENFLDPAQASKIRDCQNWVEDFVGLLVQRGVLPESATQVVRENMDPQTGLALRSVNSLITGPPGGSKR
ncbi:uncharacterized protein K489DRAFT_143682 [Dissoconium aciculare CBS 342.82]|uniref:Uncharacterized protein n=1 Tax=Dissoconium aciculare CBS 342.82 TaxID=1314786 RepID=A0A6J3MB54_9PEZI|nr:uncharacterized protein K489DRAFT_143682 [Dissoconium aciculare CBS 342.82]KAF1824869.1 hypothetical protein K489DRAFT_143682 [Dissoconium aciculare CBS 342.82]